jgi:hypothetical protein
VYGALGEAEIRLQPVEPQRNPDSVVLKDIAEAMETAK